MYLCHKYINFSTFITVIIKKASSNIYVISGNINYFPFFQVDYFVKLMKIDDQTDEYTALDLDRLLPKLISNSLARMINYSGSGDKLILENTKLHEAISCKLKFV